uniref:SHANK associated RH domain interactor n=1 Tax=Zosterops lateralis melanops TaxID=1220523 RepID=A0A8D2PCD7_ZOSLA
MFSVPSLSLCSCVPIPVPSCLCAHVFLSCPCPVSVSLSHPCPHPCSSVPVPCRPCPQQPVAEFDLRDISYHVCGPASHELQLPPQGTGGTAGSPGPSGTEGTVVALRFPEEREAQQWWTVLSSSLREARRVPSPCPCVSLGVPNVPMSPEELALQLAEAVAFGDEVMAAQSAVALARRHAELSVSLRDKDRQGTEISLSVVVEDAASSAAITLRVQPHITIGTLKEQVFRELGFPALAQRWIIGQSLCRDGRSLSSYGIRGDGDTAFLFLLTATAAGLGRQQQAQSLLRAAGLGDASPGWPCPRCTFLNKPTRPGCEMCSSPRPEGYRVPGGHRPDPAEQQRLQREQDGTRQCQQVWS